MHRSQSSKFYSLFPLLSISFIAIFAPLSMTAKPSKKDAKELQALSKKICAKMSECMKKETAKLPPDQRKMIESMYPTGNVCEAQYLANTSINDASPSNEKVTKEDIKNMKKCAEDMSKMSCEKLMEGDQPSSCEKFQDR